MLQTIETRLDTGLNAAATALHTARTRYPIITTLVLFWGALGLLLALAGTFYYGGYQDGLAAEVACGS